MFEREVSSRIASAHRRRDTPNSMKVRKEVLHSPELRDTRKKTAKLISEIMGLARDSNLEIDLRSNMIAFSSLLDHSLEESDYILHSIMANEDTFKSALPTILQAAYAFESHSIMYKILSRMGLKTLGSSGQLETDLTEEVVYDILYYIKYNSHKPSVNKMCEIAQDFMAINKPNDPSMILRVMHGYAFLGYGDKADKYLEEGLSSGLSEGILEEMYRCVITAYLNAGDTEKALYWRVHMQNERKIAPTKESFSVWSACPEVLKSESLRKLFVDPDNSHNTQESLESLAKRANEFLPSDFSRMFIDQIQHSKVKLTSRRFNDFLATLTSEGKHDHVLDVYYAIKLLQQKISESNEGNQNQILHVIDDRTFSLLIRIAAKEQDDTKRAARIDKILGELQLSRVPKKYYLSVYNLAVYYIQGDSYGGTKGKNDPIKIIERMRDLNIRPNATTYHMAIKSCRFTGDTSTALHLTKDMIASGLPVGYEIYKALLHVYAQEGNKSESLKILRKMTSDPKISTKVSIEDYNIAARAGRVDKDIKHIEGVFSNAVANGFKLDEYGCKLGVQTCISGQQYESALKWLQNLYDANHRSMSINPLFSKTSTNILKDKPRSIQNVLFTFEYMYTKPSDSEVAIPDLHVFDIGAKCAISLMGAKEGYSKILTWLDRKSFESLRENQRVKAITSKIYQKACMDANE
ncbi:hypothetical protein AAMO2058_001481600 [Amorphochlora amoebiformis]